MARPKKLTKEELTISKRDLVENPILMAAGVQIGDVGVEVNAPISLLTIDYPNEAINDIARKVNELIERANNTQ